MDFSNQDKMSKEKLNRNSFVSNYVKQCVFHMNKNSISNTKKIIEERNGKVTNETQLVQEPKKILKLSKKDGDNLVKTVHFALDNLDEAEDSSDVTEVKDESMETENGVSNQNDEYENETESKIVTEKDWDQTSESQITTHSENSLSDISFKNLEKYNLTKFPFAIKNKYLALFKAYGFPFKKLGSFSNNEPKNQEKSLDSGIRDLIEDTIEEAHELFSEAGYEETLINWLAYYWNKNPDNPKRHTLKQSLGKDEFNRFFCELKHNLALENELAFELQQIKLLCGIIDEENYGLDGKYRSEWDTEMTRRAMKFKKCKMSYLVRKLKEVDEEIREAKKKNLIEKKGEKSRKREQVLQDLQLWKQYSSPTMEGFIRDKDFVPDDGRIKDWFECVYIRDKGVRQAPIRLLDEDEIYGEPVTLFDKESVDSAIEWH